MKNHKPEEFYWPVYTKEYSNQLDHVKKENDLYITDFVDNNGEIEFTDNLHNNWREIYSTAYRIKPYWIFEVGFGSAMHMVNLSKILPESNIFGCDLLQSQLDLAINKYGLSKELQDNTYILDFSEELPELLTNGRPFDFVYSQACLMHTGSDKIIKMLRNIEKIANSHVLLIEGKNNHENWFDLVKDTLPEFEFKLTSKYIDYGILLTRK